MKSTWQICCICLGVVVLGAVLQPGQASENEPRRTLTVTGRGEVQAKPDIARLHVGVVTHAQMAQAAMDSNTKTMREVQRGLKDRAIAAKDIQTTRLTVTPQHQRRQSGQPVTPGIVGYQVRHTLQVTVRDVSRVGAVLDTVMQLGANHLNAVQFLIEDDVALLDKARLAAVREARRKAELFASAAGVMVGEVVSIHEAGSVRPPPRPMMHIRAAESVPVAPGEQTLQVTVTVVFALRQQ